MIGLMLHIYFRKKNSTVNRKQLIWDLFGSYAATWYVLSFLCYLQYTSKAIGRRVTVKINEVEEKTMGCILLPCTAQKNVNGWSQSCGWRKSCWQDHSCFIVHVTTSPPHQAFLYLFAYFLWNSEVHFFFHSWSFTPNTHAEVEFDDVKHLIFKCDVILGLLETKDIKWYNPLND